MHGFAHLRTRFYGHVPMTRLDTWSSCKAMQRSVLLPCMHRPRVPPLNWLVLRRPCKLLLLVLHPMHFVSRVGFWFTIFSMPCTLLATTCTTWLEPASGLLSYHHHSSNSSCSYNHSWLFPAYKAKWHPVKFSLKQFLNFCYFVQLKIAYFQLRRYSIFNGMIDSTEVQAQMRSSSQSLSCSSHVVTEDVERVEHPDAWVLC
jgi:hypothetical protein